MGRVFPGWHTYICLWKKRQADTFFHLSQVKYSPEYICLPNLGEKIYWTTLLSASWNVPLYCASDRTIRRGWICGSLRHGEVSATSPTRATTPAGRNTLTKETFPIPSTSSWLPTWRTWRRTPRGRDDLARLLLICRGPFKDLFSWWSAHSAKCRDWQH